MQESKVILDFFHFSKELFRQFGVFLPFLHTIHEINEFKFCLDDFFVVIDRILSQPVDILTPSFDLILQIFQPVIEGDHFGLNFIDGGSCGIFEEIILVLLGFNLLEHQWNRAVNVLLICLKVFYSFEDLGVETLLQLVELNNLLLVDLYGQLHFLQSGGVLGLVLKKLFL